MTVYCLFRNGEELVRIYYLEEDAEDACQCLLEVDKFCHYHVEPYEVKGYYA